MADHQLSLKITADGTGLSGTLKTASGELRSFSTQAEQSAGRAERSLNKVEAASKRTAERLGTALGVAATAVAAGFALLVRQQINYAASVGDVAQRSGVGAQAISGMASAARIAGTDFNAVASALDAFGDKAQRAAGGSRQHAAAFTAMGISLRDTDGKLRSTQSLLEEATRKLAGYADGNAKTALATQLFGGRARELLPVLNQLGEEGIQGVIDKARAMGQVVDGDMAAAATTLQVQLRTLREEVGGYAMQVGNDVLPALIALSGAWIDNDTAAKGAAGGMDRASTSATGVGQAIKNVIAGLVSMYGAAQQVGVYFADFFARLETDWEATKRKLSDGTWWQGFASMVAAGLSGNGALFTQAQVQLQAANQKIDAELAARRAANKAALETSLADIEAGTTRMLDKLLASTKDAATGINASTGGLNKPDAPLPKFGRTAEQAADKVRKLAASSKDLQQAFAALDRILGGTRDLDEQLAQGADILAGLDDAQVQYNASLREANALYEDALALGPPTAAMQEAEAERLAKLAALRDQRIAIRDQQEATRAWQEAERAQLQRSRQLWGDWADAVFDAVTRSGNFLKNLLANVKQIVIQILREWFKTRIVGAFVGGGGGGWGGMAMGAAGVAVSGGAFGSSGGGSTGYAGTSGGGFDFMSTNSWISAGKSLWNGFTSGYMSGGQYAGSSMFGTWSNGAQFAGDMGPGWAGASTYNPSALGYGAAAIGGAYAGYQRWQGSNKDFAGGVGAAAYGVGTYSAAIGAGAAISGGAMAGLAAIPVVGWIAIAAMLVDMISGGKLFGTGFRPNDVKQDIGVRPDGAYAAVTMGEVRQQALFGGREWRDKPMDVPPEMLEAAERFYRQIEKVMVDGARRLAIDTPAMIDATIRTQSELDKKGNVKSTKYIVQTLGREWEEASAELAATRVSAEAIVATVAASEAGKAASQIAEQWRHSAETLMDGAQMMLAATSDIIKGRGLLSHGTGLDPNGAVGLPPLPPGAGGGGGGGPGDAGPPMLVKDAVSEANDELARTVALVQELAHADESLSDAYARLAQDTNLLQQALDLAGVTIDKTAEDFVRLAAGIEEAAGGLQQAQALWQGFFEAFYGQAELGAQNIALMRQDVTAQLAGLGLDATTTMEQFRAEFESKLPTLSADEIVQWLQAGNALANLTSATAQLAMQVSQVLGPMGLMGQGLSGFGQALVAIKQQESAAIDAANALAKSRGAEGASAIQLAAIHQWTARQIAAAIRQLQAETRRLIADLYGEVPGSLDLINQRIGELEGAAGNVADSIDRVAEAGDNLFERWAAGVESVQQYLDSMLLGDLSALSPEEQLAEAQRQLIEMQAAAMGGDADALARLPQLADAYLRLARGSLASGEDYNAQFGWVRQLLTAVTELPNPGDAPGAAAPGGGGPVQVAPSPELQALYEARDAALAAQEAEYRRELAQQLASHLSDLATLLNVPILELIEAQGVNLKQLATDLGVDLKNLNAASIEALGGMALTLGIPLSELVAGLDLTLPDLREGLTELTRSLGIDLTQLTGDTATQLAALAGSLGTNLRDLSTALGIDLGKLTDINSPIFQALSANIGDLSPDIKAELTPLLDAVKNAAGDEQKNEAVKALRDHVDQLAPDIRNALGPFFDDIFPKPALDQLDYLADIQGIAQQQLDVLSGIRNNLKAANDDAGIPSYAVGTPWVQGDQIAQIHHGEAVVPAAVNQWLRTTGWRVGGGTGGDVSLIVAELKQVNDRLDRLDRNNSAGHAGTQSATTREGERARTQRDDIARRQEQTIKRIA